jgi:hypothetical protein
VSRIADLIAAASLNLKRLGRVAQKRSLVVSAGRRKLFVARLITLGAHLLLEIARCVLKHCLLLQVIRDFGELG